MLTAFSRRLFRERVFALDTPDDSLRQKSDELKWMRANSASSLFLNVFIYPGYHDIIKGQWKCWIYRAQEVSDKDKDKFIDIPFIQRYFRGPPFYIGEKIPREVTQELMFANIG